MAENTPLGWYGKLPTTGDFLQSRLPETTINSWSNCFQLGLTHWYHLPQHNTDLFSRTPVWNFALPAILGVQQLKIGCLIIASQRTNWRRSNQ